MKTIKSLILAAGMLTAPAMAHAVAAYPGLITVQQPDGTELQIRIMGDEHSSYLLSEDGYLLKEQNRTVYYADVDASGNIVSSGIEASAPSNRSAVELAYLNGVDMKGRVLPALRERRTAALQTRMRPTATTVSGTAPGLFPKKNFPAFGKQKSIVILVEFQDQEFFIDNPLDYFTRMLNEEGFSDNGSVGSAAQWYRENSNGQFDPEFDVYGPVKLPENLSYYGGPDGTRNDIRPQKMAIHACQILDDKVDFSQYDTDGDGIIDNVFIYFAGEGQNFTHVADHIWPHSWDISIPEPDERYVFDNVQLEHYACTNEWVTPYQAPDGIGTFCHEFGHVLGLPDIYSTHYSGVLTPDTWDVMDRGNYNNKSRTPPHFSVFERNALGWLDTKELTADADVRLKPIATNTGCRISTANQFEYFLLENRQQEGWDKFIPGHGLVIWHIDYDSNVWYNNVVNDYADHQYVDMEEADGNVMISDRTGDAFPGSANVTEFTDYTNPSMRSWNGKNTGKPVTAIAEDADGIITFRFMEGGRELTPAEVKVSDVHHEGFTIDWTTQVAADSYMVNVYTLNGGEKVFADGYRNYDAGANTSLEVKGLTPSTNYHVTVTAMNDYSEALASDVVKVTTGAAEFRNFAPESLEAADVEANAFTARWKAMDDATDYRLHVYTRTLGEPEVSVCDFTDGVAPGWFANSTYTYTAGSYVGQEKPSLRMSEDGVYVRSPKFAKDIRGFSFWTRGNNTKGNLTLEISGLVDGKWVVLDRHVPEDKGHTYTLENVPAGLRSVKVQMHYTSTCSAAIDDLTIEWGGDDIVTDVADYTAHATGNVTEHRVEGVNEQTAYFYTVSGVRADGTVSRASAEQPLVTLKGTGIESVEGATLTVSVVGRTISVSGARGPVSVSTPAGLVIPAADGRLTVGAPGIYLVSDGSAVSKVVVK